ncbi:MAG TPA: DUF5671 domain-containing protein [Candidatus Paceibacterota bacterium]|nr:DUF5671 domain-containing protein [Candidatus Paceibacterota bacterium]
MHMKVTPKDFFLWAGAMIALYVSVFSFLALMFQYINRAFPDITSAYVDPYSTLIRFSIASLLVLFPTFLGLSALIRRDILAEPAKKDLWVRRWALTLTLFIAGVTVAIDLVTLVNTYLGGEVTIRFVLKVLIVLLVAIGGFLHFFADLRGYWIAQPKRARAVAIGAGVLALATIISGILIMGTPGQVRQYRLDADRVNDLQQIQYQVVQYWQSKGEMPQTLSALNDSISGFMAPTDPETSQPYGYSVEGPHSFELCATFDAEAQANAADLSGLMAGYGSDLMQDTWWHGAGKTCFTRTIDPQLYPTRASTTPR